VERFFGDQGVKHTSYSFQKKNNTHTPSPMVSSLFVSFTTHQIEIASFPRALAAGVQVNGPSSQLHRHGLPTVPPACWPVVVLPQPHPHFPAALSQPGACSADLINRFGLFRFISSHTILFILPIKSYSFYQSNSLRPLRAGPTLSKPQEPTAI